MRTKNSLVRIVMAGLLPLAATFNSLAWDYEGHRIINQLALASLPRSFPRFALKAQARERVAFLSGEPDRWRNTSELTLKHAKAPDHFLDIELLAAYQLDPSRLSPFRYEFTAQLALGRAAPSSSCRRPVNRDAMKVSEVLKRLRRDGWYRIKSRGGHRQFKHPSKPGLVTVAGHPAKVLAPKTLKSILRQAGLAP